MRENRLEIAINRSAKDIFSFVTTPPNSARWIDGIAAEETNEQPIKVGTIYRLKAENNDWSEVTVTALEADTLVEWVSEDGNYHCRYVFEPLGENLTGFTYYEWVNNGELSEPFDQETLQRLKAILESPAPPS